MADLLSMPVEILLHILQDLSDAHENESLSLTEISGIWSRYHQAMAKSNSRYKSDLYALQRVNRRLHRLVQPMLYSGSVSFQGSSSRLSSFLESLSRQDATQVSITTASGVPCFSGAMERLVRHVPTIHTLEIDGSTFANTMIAPVKKSNVAILRISNICNHPRKLNHILSFMGPLKELSVEINGHSVPPDSGNRKKKRSLHWSVFVQQHIGTLETLRISILNPSVHAIITMRPFVIVKPSHSLLLRHIALPLDFIPAQLNARLWTPSIQSAAFFCHEAMRPLYQDFWALQVILRDKHAFWPMLSKIVVYSTENFALSQEHLSDERARALRDIELLKHDFAQAGVELITKLDLEYL